MTQLSFDLFAPAVLADPYPLYHALRAEASVWRAPEGQWVLTRYDDVIAALHDPRLIVGLDAGRVTAFPESVRETVRVLMQPISLFVVECNPPEHTRLRALLNKGLTPRVVESLRARIQAQVDILLDAIAAGADPVTGESRCDIIKDFAYPLPAVVISAMLGLPPETHIDFRKWANNLSVLWGPTTMPDLVERVRRCERSVVALRGLFIAVIAARRARPGEDIISALLAAEEAGSVLSDEELMWNCILLLIAGHETTMDLIGNGLLALLHHPGELGKLQADPSLIPTGVEELLRHDAPFQFMQREAREEVTLGGTTIRATEAVC